MSLHFLPFGSVVRLNKSDEQLDVMVVDWVVKPDGADYSDYLGVVWPRGFLHVEDSEKTYQKVSFNADEIEVVRFIGLSHNDFEEKDNKAFEFAKENNMSIAKLFEAGELHTFETPSAARVAKKLPQIATREGAKDDYYPVGTVVTVDATVGDSDETVEKDVMIVAFGPDYFKKDVDYQIMPWKEGFCGVDFPLGIYEEEIKNVKSLGFINADVQFAVSSRNRNAEKEAANNA